MLYVFEMANNHQGSLDHALKIVNEFSMLAKQNNLIAGIKLQFRQLDTFIHNDYKNIGLKYVKRFNETRLEKEDFAKIIKQIKLQGLSAIATPFDNESLAWIEDLDIDIIKIASCSIDDWPLLNAIVKINKRVIISTAGASFETLDKVYNLFKKNNRDFSFMHCVGEYPTPVEFSNLNRINLLMNRYQDIEVGISTHESPLQKSIVPYAAAIGCKILEKHVGIATETLKLNEYSCNIDDIQKIINEVQFVQKIMLTTSTKQNKELESLKRGIYIYKELQENHIIEESDLYFAMPIQDGQASVADIDLIIGKKTNIKMLKDKPIMKSQCFTKQQLDILKRIRDDSEKLLQAASIITPLEEKFEVSAHYGIDKFYQIGALIINKINRAYCKKLILMQPNQKHPIHHHIKKEETFELLYGDCILNLDGKDIKLVKGKPILIQQGIDHSFSTLLGCVIEEISTTHYIGDSIYKDHNIFKLKINERKFYI